MFLIVRLSCSSTRLLAFLGQYRCMYGVQEGMVKGTLGGGRSDSQRIVYTREDLNEQLAGETSMTLCGWKFNRF